VTDEGDTRHRRLRSVVGEHELWPAPAPAERLALLVRTLVRIVATEGPVADQKRADPADDLAHYRVRPEVFRQPGHVTTPPGDEAVQGHGGRVQHRGHVPYLRRNRMRLASVETATGRRRP